MQGVAEREGQKLRREAIKTHSLKSRLRKRDLEDARQASIKTTEIAQREADRTRNLATQGRNRTRLLKDRDRNKNRQINNRDDIRTTDLAASTAERARLRTVERLQTHLNKLTLAEQKLAKAGLATAAAHNRATAAATGAAGPTKSLIRHTTVLSGAQLKQQSAMSRLEILNNQAATSAVKLRIEQLKLNRELNKTSGAATKAGTGVSRMNKSVAQTGTRFQAARQSVIGFIRDIRSFAAFAIIFGAARGLTNAIDGYDNLQNKLKNVTDSQKELNEVTNEIFDIAKRARVPVGDLAKSFVRFDLALKSLGRSQQESLQLTETVSKLLTLNGNSAEESAAALLQLSQAFSKGKLDGDEFRSVMELMPQTFQNGLIKVLGITRKELFDFSKDGKITAEVLAEAFANMKDEVETAFQGLEKTLGQRLTNFGTEFTRVFGEFNKQVGITRKLGDAIGFATENLDKMVIALKAIATLAAVFVGFKTATKAANLMGTAISKLAQSVFLLARGGNALTGFVLFRDKQLGDKISSLVGKLRTPLKTLKEFGRITIPGAVVGGLATAVGLVIAFSDKIQLVKGEAATLADWFNALGRQVGNFFNSLFEGIELDGPLEKVRSTFQSIFDSLRNAVGFVADWVPQLLDASLGLASAFSKGFEALSERINEPLTTFNNLGESRVVPTWERIVGIIAGFFFRMFRKIAEFAAKIAVVIGNGFASVIGGAIDSITKSTSLLTNTNLADTLKIDGDKIQKDIDQVFSELEGPDLPFFDKAFNNEIAKFAKDGPFQQAMAETKKIQEQITRDRLSAERKAIADQLKLEQEKLEGLQQVNADRIQNANESIPQLVAAEQSLQQQLTNARQGNLTQIQQSEAQIRALRLQDQQQQIQEELSKSQQILQSTQTTEQQKTQVERTQTLLRQELKARETQAALLEKERQKNQVLQIENQITENQRQQETLKQQSVTSSVNFIVTELQRMQNAANQENQNMETNWDSSWQRMLQSAINVINQVINHFNKVSGLASFGLSLPNLPGGTGGTSSPSAFDSGSPELSASNTQLETLGQSLDGIDSRIQQLTSGLAGLNSNFQQLSSNANGASAGVDNLSGSANGLAGTAGAAGSGLDGLAGSEFNASNAADNLSNSVNGANGALGSQGGHASNASSGLDRYANSANNAASASANLANSGKNGFGGLTNSVNSFANNSNSALGSVFNNVQQSLSNFVRTGKFDFKELLRSIVDDMLRLVTSKLFGQFMQGISGGGASAGGGGLLSGIFGGGGGLFGGGGGLFGGGLLGGGLLGFASGGLIPAGERVIRVNERGQETVMNNQATRKYGPMLNAMNRGRSITPVGNGGGTIKQSIVINNNASNTDVETRQDEDGNLEVIIRRIADERINSNVPRLVASNVQNPNSRVSKALGSSTNAQRRRG